MPERETCSKWSDLNILVNVRDSCHLIYSFNLSMPAVNPLTNQGETARHQIITAVDTLIQQDSSENVMLCKDRTIKSPSIGFMEVISSGIYGYFLFMCTGRSRSDFFIFRLICSQFLDDIIGWYWLITDSLVLMFNPHVNTNFGTERFYSMHFHVFQSFLFVCLFLLYFICSFYV